MQALRVVVVSLLLSTTWAGETSGNVLKNKKMLRAQSFDTPQLPRSAPRLEVGPKVAIPDEDVSQLSTKTDEVDNKATSEVATTDTKPNKATKTSDVTKVL